MIFSSTCPLSIGLKINPLNQIQEGFVKTHFVVDTFLHLDSPSCPFFERILYIELLFVLATNARILSCSDETIKTLVQEKRNSI